MSSASAGAVKKEGTATVRQNYLQIRGEILPPAWVWGGGKGECLRRESVPTPPRCGRLKPAGPPLVGGVRSSYSFRVGEVRKKKDSFGIRPVEG